MIYWNQYKQGTCLQESKAQDMCCVNDDKLDGVDGFCLNPRWYGDMEGVTNG